MKGWMKGERERRERDWVLVNEASTVASQQ